MELISRKQKRVIEFEGVPFEEEAAEAVLEFMQPDEELGWPGVGWFDLDNAKELIGHLWENGFVIRKCV